MFSTSTASTTTSGSGRAVGGTACDRRVRVVRLVRPRRAGPAYGFALRGGREYATGFFVSKVDFNSEAHLQGLKVRFLSVSLICSQDKVFNYNSLSDLVFDYATVKPIIITIYLFKVGWQ